MVHIHRLRDSFRYAAKGLRLVLRTEQNFRIQLVTGILVFAAALWLALPTWKIIVILMLVAFVLVLELINSIFERLADSFHPRIHQSVEEMKDIMAAAVLIASLGSALIGIILFWPHLALLFAVMIR